MNASSRAATAAPYHGDNKLILGIVLAVVTFWLLRKRRSTLRQRDAGGSADHRQYQQYCQKLLQTMGYRKPMLLGCSVTGIGILMTAFTFLLVKPYLVVAFLDSRYSGLG